MRVYTRPLRLAVNSCTSPRFRLLFSRRNTLPRRDSGVRKESETRSGRRARVPGEVQCVASSVGLDEEEGRVLKGPTPEQVFHRHLEALQCEQVRELLKGEKVAVKDVFGVCAREWYRLPVCTSRESGTDCLSLRESGTGCLRTHVIRLGRVPGRRGIYLGEGRLGCLSRPRQ